MRRSLGGASPCVDRGFAQSRRTSSKVHVQHESLWNMSTPWRPPYTPITTSSLFHSPPDLIVDKLYLGNLNSASDKELLDGLGIKSILTIASNVGPPKFPGAFKYTEVSIIDSSHVNIVAHFELCFKAIDEGIKSGGILVHCVAGMSRSATVVIAYLMARKGLSFQEAFAHVKRCRPIAQPNYGFMRQLEKFEAYLRSERDRAVSIKA